MAESTIGSYGGNGPQSVPALQSNPLSYVQSGSSLASSSLAATVAASALPPRSTANGVHSMTPSKLIYSTQSQSQSQSQSQPQSLSNCHSQTNTQTYIQGQTQAKSHSQSHSQSQSQYSTHKVVEGQSMHMPSTMIPSNMVTSNMVTVGGSSVSQKGGNGESRGDGSRGGESLSVSEVSMYGPDAYLSETRKVSTAILSSTPMYESHMESMLQDTRRVVEVPTVEEQVRYVTKREVREIEKQVPVVEYEYIDKVVEVPKVVYRDVVSDTDVEIREVVVEKRVPQIVERPVRTIIDTKRREVRQVERVREVPGETIEIEKPYRVETRREVENVHEREVPVIVSQTVKPVITVNDKSVMEIDVFDYEAEIIPVDIHVAKPVPNALQVSKEGKTTHRLVAVSPAQYNTILKELNHHLPADRLPLVPNENNELHFSSAPSYVIAPDNIAIDNYRPSTTHTVAHTHTQAGALPTSRLMERREKGDGASVSLATAPSHSQSQTHTYVTRTNNRALPETKQSSNICCAGAQPSTSVAGSRDSHVSLHPGMHARETSYHTMQESSHMSQSHRGKKSHRVSPTPPPSLANSKRSQPSVHTHHFTHNDTGSSFIATRHQAEVKSSRICC